MDSDIENEEFTAQDMSILERELMDNVERMTSYPEDVKQVGRAISLKLDAARRFIKARDWLRHHR